MVMAPMVTCFANSLGEVTPRMVDYYVERAKGGGGTIVVEAMDIDDRMLFNRLGIFPDRFINQVKPPCILKKGVIHRGKGKKEIPVL